MLLQLLTGQEGARVVSTVERARADPLQFMGVIDRSAGSWPATEALAFADLALKCTEVRRQDRPDLRCVPCCGVAGFVDGTRVWARQGRGGHGHACLVRVRMWQHGGGSGG